MDPLREDDVARARATPAGQKLLQALALMRIGYAIERAKLRARHPGASDAEVEAMFRRWQFRDE